MLKPYALEGLQSDIELFVVITQPIKYRGETHPAGSTIAVSPADKHTLIVAGVAIPATISETLKIEEELPAGLSPLIWRADPRLTVIGQKPSSFVKIADFEESHPRR